MTVMLDITERVKPPRAVFLDFPPGHTTGAPFDAAMQERIVREALAALETVQQSGTVVRLPDRWPGGEGWKARPLPERLPRFDTPQYQTQADLVAAEAHDAGACPICVTG